MHLSNMKSAALFLLLALLLESALCVNLNPPKSNSGLHTQAQYVHDKEDPLKQSDQTSEEEQQDPYQLLNERMPPQFNSWNPYQSHQQATNKFLPFMGYPQPIFIPYPLIISPEMFYPINGQNDIEDAMARAGNRRTPSYRNSPIYYVRLPPTPYMFIPGLGYHSQPGTFQPNFSPILPYNSFPAVPLSSIFNLPVNFLANGKPNGIYQMESPNDLQSQMPMPTMTPQRQHPLPPPPPPASYRPSYLPQQPFISPSTDTKMTNLKRPFVFNGRPEDIYILPNNFNPMQSMYQDSLSGYY
ncbi:uncharacterized protein LOC129916050 [Episyrphus balteatus]|uniref:uncharacterized protein LOC129916050 n=1 Tax=Episyrphus balteatus TaxID=286459 RepID=UPI00248574D8|nr:uncharacterized protein LOC129916050 [Episyrphus balteatus]